MPQDEQNLASHVTTSRLFSDCIKNTEKITSGLLEEQFDACAGLLEVYKYCSTLPKTILPNLMKPYQTLLISLTLDPCTHTCVRGVNIRADILPHVRAFTSQARMCVHGSSPKFVW